MVLDMKRNTVNLQHVGVPFFRFALCSPQFVILLVSEFEGDLSGLLLNHHCENVSVFERLGAVGASRELDQSFVGAETCSARQGPLNSLCCQI